MAISLATLITTVIGSVVTTVMLALGAILCGPCADDFKSCIEGCYTDIKSCVGGFFMPTSDGDLDKLRTMKNRITLVSPSEERKQWISDANNVLNGYGPSSDQNVGLQSCCLVGDKYLWCGLRRKVKELLTKGGRIIRGSNLIEYIPGVAELQPGTVADWTLNEVMGMLHDDEVGRIGIWGPQGIGKTTIVKALNNKLMESHPNVFNFVIFVQQTEDVDVKYVQKTISEKLYLQVDETMDTKGIADCIYGALEKKKFLLILDNVSKLVDLKSIGVPENRGISKIVLTSRDDKVCVSMNAKPIHMKAKPFYGAFVDAVRFVKFANDVSQDGNGLPQVLSNVLDGKLDLAWKYQNNIQGPLSKTIGWCINKLQDSIAK